VKRCADALEEKIDRYVLSGSVAKADRKLQTFYRASLVEIAYFLRYFKIEGLNSPSVAE
jgi:hypothetical protein